MAICINQSGTWRNITVKCVNQAGTWRNVLTGCINQAGTWRRYGMEVPPTVSISVSPTSVIRSGSEGETSTLSWSSTNATTVVSTTNFSTSATSGSLTVGPSATTTYSITVGNAVYQTSASATLTVTAPTLGSAFGGGILLCRAAGVNWIISPASAEISSSTWNNRGLSNTCAQTISGCTGWFVPDCTQLKGSPVFTCKIYWYVSGNNWWSDTEFNATNAWFVTMTNGTPVCGSKAFPVFVRSLRVVNY
jgi:hypothetical protein